MQHRRNPSARALVLVVAASTVAACSSDRAGPTSPLAPTAGIAASAAPVVTWSSVVPASCAEVLAANPGAADGVYVVAPTSGPAAGLGFEVHCDMSGSSGAGDYLELVNTGGTFNFSEGHHGSFANYEIVTHYSRLRLDPATLRVDIGDGTFSTSNGAKVVSFASASGCYSAFNRTGRGNIDLTGTAFAVRSHFNVGGFQPAGSVNGEVQHGGYQFFVDGEQVVDLTGGGYCGGISAAADFHAMFGPAGGYSLQLSFVGTSLDVTAPVISLAGNRGEYLVHEQVEITCSVSDAGGSGIDAAATSCPAVSGPALSFLPGQTVSAYAADNAGNYSTAATELTVLVTSGGVCELAKGWVSKAGVAHSMCQQLANGAYGAFANHVRAQSGKSVSAANAATLIQLAGAL